MTRKDDAKIAALAKKNAAKEFKPKGGVTPKYDETLKHASEEDNERKRFFKDMKRREF